jgi:hypothetical protein
VREALTKAPAITPEVCPPDFRVSGQVRGAVQQESWYLVSAQYLSNRSAPTPDPADADTDVLPTGSKSRPQMAARLNNNRR